MTRAIAAVQAACGLALGFSPRAVVRAAGFGDDGRTVMVARLVGARLLLQALVEARWPRRRVVLAAAGADALHAASMAGVATVSDRYRKAALTSAALAAAFATALAAGEVGQRRACSVRHSNSRTSRTSESTPVRRR